MNKRLLGALLSVSNTSADAKALASKVMAENSAEIVRQLRETIDRLEQQVADLTSIVVEPEQVSDADLRELEVSFTARLKAADGMAMRKYDAQMLRQYPKFVRPSLARALINKATELGIKPLDVWSDVIALDGEIK